MTQAMYLGSLTDADPGTANVQPVIRLVDSGILAL
jgi:hypothetical protein